MKLVLTSTAFAAMTLCLPAFAADLPPVEEIQQQAYYDWSGAYLGLHVGFGWADSDLSSPLPALIDPAVDNDELEADGVFGGIQGGYNFQSGNFVFGIEADFSGTGIDGDVVIDPVPGPGTLVEADVNWMASVRGRIGYAFDHILPYVTGGFAAADVDVSANDLPIPGGIFTGSETFTGWIVGGGVEMGFTENLSAKIEYLYADLGEETFVVLPAVAGGTVDADLRVQTVKVGINYRF